MDLTSRQRRHASAAWSKICSTLDISTQDPIASSTHTFIALALLNLPAPATYYLIKTRATRQAIQEWPETWNARWVAHYFPDKKASLLAEHISSRVREALQGFTSMLVLSPLTTSKNRWWTLVTANFTHFNLSHLASNMLALNAIGPACAEVPGMSPQHVLGITLFTSLATGFQALYRLSDSSASWRMCGFSAVLCAFTSVAALGAPQAEPDVFGKFPVKARSVWTVAAMQIIGDLVSIVRARSGSAKLQPGKTEAVDYVAHLVGYACGAAYYACLLWRESAGDDDDTAEGVEQVGDGEDDKPAERSANVWNEILRTRSQAAPVSQSEDWEEIASKLRSPAAEEGQS